MDKSIYHDLDMTILLAKQYALDHGCNYNITIMNPNDKKEFDLNAGSTYEIVRDSYFEKDRPNAVLLHKTNDMIAPQEFIKKEENKDGDKFGINYFGK